MTTFRKNNIFTTLSTSQIEQLERQGCYSSDWNRVSIAEGSDLHLIRNSRFYGDVIIGLLSPDDEGREGIYNAVIRNCRIGSHPQIHSIGGELNGLIIGNNVRIENTGSVVMHLEASMSIGLPVNVLDETGGRPVYIFPGISSQLATLMALNPKWTQEHIPDMISQSFPDTKHYASIGDNVSIINCGEIINVGINSEITINGAAKLSDGLIINTCKSSDTDFVSVGTGVDACNFIIENGRIGSKVTLRNCYVGEGAVLDKGLTAHDSLFFANSACENGEICATIAGPYTVSMHKSTLLIGGIYSFMNAGSGTNFSNHMYKLGPVHWGILQRGVKTSSNSYTMWGARIGAFSLLMGSHKSHPDTSWLPFSYLFSDSAGNTIAVPGIMLRSCGLHRDEVKWPARDLRKEYAMQMTDHLMFETLNPATVQSMIEGIDTLTLLKDVEKPRDGYYQHRGIKISARSVNRGIEYYRLGILAYLWRVVGEDGFDLDVHHKSSAQWIDLGGQIITENTLRRAMKVSNIKEIQTIFNQAFTIFPKEEKMWAYNLLQQGWHKHFADARHASETLDRLVADDRRLYLEQLAAENNKFNV